MAVGLAMAAASAVPALIKAGKGIAQKRAAKKIKPKDREIAQEYKDYQKKKAARATSSKMAGQDRTEEKIEGKYSNALKKAQNASSSNRYLQEVSRAASSSADKITDVELQATKDKVRRVDDSDQALQEMGDRTQDLTDSVRDEKIAAKSALSEAGSKNLMSAAKDGASIAQGLLKANGKGFGMGDVDAGEGVGSKNYSGMTDENTRKAIALWKKQQEKNKIQ
jgi:hypothetical protein